MIFITGSSGFVGSNILEYFSKDIIYSYNRGDILNLDRASIVINLAGKAHDLKRVTSVDEYYNVNTNFTIKIFDAFLHSNAKVFITLSSVKAVADELNGNLTEETIPQPLTHYGKSKLLAEQYILSNPIPEGKRVYILRPCMIHGPGNKGNLNLLFKLVRMGMPWPLGAFENKRSFCSIDNLCFIINELISNATIPSGIYNISDNEPLSTNDIMKMIAESQGKNLHIWKMPKTIIKLLSKIGDIINLPLNTERLNKLTGTYLVSNRKIITAINKPLPLSSKEGLIKSLNSFNTNA
jgi:nucleoside-diphosphate-sugar epimerase